MSAQVSRPSWRRGRPTIGLLADNLYDGFNRSLWTSVRRAAEAHDANLLCFLGGAVSPGPAPRPRWGRNCVFDLVAPACVDGIIVLSGAVGHLLSPDELRAFVDRFRPLPVVSVSAALEGAASLVIDPGPGLGEVLDHLIVPHARRRLAFIRGPEANPDAAARFECYRQALARHGLSYDERLVYQGRFDRGSGRKAVEAFLDERRIAFDALVGVNDYTALHAMQELQRRGIAVPEEVAVTGFDDLPEASAAIPSLTSVRQPLAELGDVALRTILARLGGVTADATVPPARAVIRRSCGCGPIASDRAGVREPVARPPSGALAHELRERFPEVAQWTGDASWATALCRAFTSELETGQRTFAALVQHLVSASLSRGGDAERWRELLGTLAARAAGRGASPAFSAAMEEALAALALLATQAQLSDRFRADEEASILRRLFQLWHRPERGMEQTLLAELPSLGISSFFLCRTDEDTRTASLAFHFDETGTAELDPALASFPAQRLIPGQFSSGLRHGFAVLPLHHLEERLGYAVCALGELHGTTFELLATHLSTAMKVGLLQGKAPLPLNHPIPPESA